MSLGSDADIDANFNHDALRARMLNTGEGGDDVINSEDDEEIESDEAFEESDEERFAGFSFAKKVLHSCFFRLHLIIKNVCFSLCGRQNLVLLSRPQRYGLQT